MYIAPEASPRRGALDKDGQMMWKHINALSGTVRKPKSCNAFFMCGALVDSVGHYIVSRLWSKNGKLHFVDVA